MPCHVRAGDRGRRQGLCKNLPVPLAEPGKEPRLIGGQNGLQMLLWMPTSRRLRRCVDVCPVEVYELQDGKSNPVNGEECLGCESCVEVCEHGAITIEEA